MWPNHVAEYAIQPLMVLEGEPAILVAHTLLLQSLVAGVCRVLWFRPRSKCCSAASGRAELHASLCRDGHVLKKDASYVDGAYVALSVFI